MELRKRSVYLKKVEWFFQNCFRDHEGNFWYSVESFANGRGEPYGELLRRAYGKGDEFFKTCLPLKKDYMKHCGKTTEVEDEDGDLVILKNVGRKCVFQKWMIKVVDGA